MLNVAALTRTLDETIEAASRCLSADSVGYCEGLGERLHTLTEVSRESFLALLAEDFLRIALKLEHGADLTEEEAAALEMLLVGDAEMYLKMERDADVWRAELRRIIGELRDVRDSGFGDPRALLRLRALCSEANRVQPDLSFYLQERERIERFRESMETLGTSQRLLLARLIREKLAPPRI
ncbi:MAG: hypothetical protein ABFS34_04255 [Gemmatimonadota bacterium]